MSCTVSRFRSNTCETGYPGETLSGSARSIDPASPMIKKLSA